MQSSFFQDGIVDRKPPTVCHINPITKEIRYILQGHVGPTETIEVNENGRMLKRRVRYIPYSEYLEEIPIK